MSTQTSDIKSQIEELTSEVGSKSSSAAKLSGRIGLPNTQIFLWGWFFISFLLLLVIAWNYLQSNVYDQGVRTGAQNTAAQIYTDMINKAANDQCNTIFVQYENRRVDLINVRCLQILSQNNAGNAETASEAKEQK